VAEQKKGRANTGTIFCFMWLKLHRTIYEYSEIQGCATHPAFFEYTDLKQDIVMGSQDVGLKEKAR
jgi:hypothetical protein